MEALHDPELRYEFSDATWFRGWRYHDEGRVERIEPAPEGRGWIAWVQGSRRRAYEVWLEVAIDRVNGGGLLDGECSCPVGYMCKHMVAALFALRERFPNDAESQRDRRQRERLTEDLTALQTWARNIEQAPVEPGSETKHKKSTKRLVYVLTIDRIGHGRAELRVEARSARVLKNGTIGKSSPFDLNQANHGYGTVPNFVSNADRIFWFRLTRVASTRPSVTPRFARSAEATALFRELVETGRCYFVRTDAPALRPGPPRRGDLRWCTHENGDQQLRVCVSPDDEASGDTSDFLAVLPLRPPHYLDPSTGMTGPLDLDLSDEIATSIADVPVLDPLTARELPRDVASTLERHGLPKPPARSVRWLDEVEAQPCLRLGTDPARRPGPEGFDNAVAQLRFVYGPLTVDVLRGLDPDGAWASQLVGDEVVRVRRDFVREQLYLARLIELGMRARFEREPIVHELDDPQKWVRFCEQGLPALREEGWEVELSDDFPLEILAGDAWYIDVESETSDWFLLEVGVEIDGQRVNLLPAVVAAIRSGRLVRDRIRVGDEPINLPLGDGRWVSVPPDRLAKMLDTLVELFDERLDGDRMRLAVADAARLLELEDFKWHGNDRLRALAQQLARQAALPRIKKPRGLKAELREYQARGLDWLGFLRAHGFGGVLADDMGLGKTVQTLAHVLVEKRARRLDRPCLVVAPRTVIHNWARECERFTPSLSHAVYHGAGREQILASKLPDLVITTYALLQRDEQLREIDWHVVILDEAQAIKNPRTRSADAARALKARQRLCLTGTPMENNLEELWSLFAFVVPGLLGGLRGFRARYRTPIEKKGDAGRMAALSCRIAPFLLRRTKAQVLAELPPKTEVLLSIPFEPRQRDLYESVRMTMEKRVRKALSERGLARSQIIVLDALLKLRQVCCHPELVKVEATRKANAGSAKTDRLIELLSELLAEGRRTVVFSQFTSMLDIVTRQLEAMGVEHRRITGKTRKRQQVVDAFQAGEFPVLLVSLKAGGTGINLTAADTVIHYDPWWNPAVESQATDRTHRIGQHQPITVYRLVCEGTVEQRMLALQERKRALTEALQRDAEHRSTGGLTLAPEDLDLLLAPAGE